MQHQPWPPQGRTVSQSLGFDISRAKRRFRAGTAALSNVDLLSLSTSPERRDSYLGEQGEDQRGHPVLCQVFLNAVNGELHNRRNKKYPDWLALGRAEKRARRGTASAEELALLGFIAPDVRGKALKTLRESREHYCRVRLHIRRDGRSAAEFYAAKRQCEIDPLRVPIKLVALRHRRRPAAGRPAPRRPARPRSGSDPGDDSDPPAAPPLPRLALGSPTVYASGSFSPRGRGESPQVEVAR